MDRAAHLAHTVLSRLSGGNHDHYPQPDPLSGVASVFLSGLLTWELNRRATDMSGMAGMDMSGMAMPQSATVLGIHLGPATVSALGSWWLIYFLMAVFHLGPWFDFGKSKS